MDLDTFAGRLKASLPKDLELDNPGRGTSTIMWCDGERVCYLRGKSRLYVAVRDLHAAYTAFAGGDVTARQLKEFAPTVYDSAKKGHNCNATFLFMALQRMGLAGETWGHGRAGSPFGVTIAPR